MTVDLQSCARCSSDSNLRLREFSDQAFAALLVWEEIGSNAIGNPICEDCYAELREVLIDRASELLEAAKMPAPKAVTIDKFAQQSKLAVGAAFGRMQTDHKAVLVSREGGKPKHPEAKSTPPGGVKLGSKGTTATATKHQEIAKPKNKSEKAPITKPTTTTKTAAKPAAKPADKPKPAKAAKPAAKKTTTKKATDHKATKKVLTKSAKKAKPVKKATKKAKPATKKSKK